MKIAAKDVANFIKNPPEKYKYILVYGPDDGLVRENTKIIMNKLTNNSDDVFAIEKLDAEKIKEEPHILFEAMSSMSLMGGTPPIVYIHDASNKITPIIKEVIESKQCSNKLVLRCGNLDTKSSLRKLLEKNKDSAVIACYRDEKYNISKIAKEKLEKAGIIFPQEVVTYLQNSLGNDRGVTISEINKIILYMGDEKKLTLDIVEKIVGQNNEKNIDDLCNAIADGNTSTVNQLFDRLLTENYPAINSITILRTVIRYFNRINIAIGFTNNGITADEALSKLSPPVFFKQKKNFLKHLYKLKKYDRMDSVLNRLLNLEIEVKRTSEQELICKRGLTSVALMCR